MSTFLRTDDERGPLVAAGLVALAVAIYLIIFRFTDDWAAGARLLVTAVPALLAVGIALFTPRDEIPPGWLSAILVVEFALVLLALGNLADAIGADQPFGSSGTLTWVGLLVTALAVVSSRRHNSAVMTLIAGISATVTLLAFVDWVFDMDDPVKTFRWLLMFAAIGLAAAGLAMRGDTRGAVGQVDRTGAGVDRSPRHGVALVNAAGLDVIFLAFTFGITAAAGAFGGDGGGGAGWGWELFILVAGAALVAFAIVNREPGPGYIGGIVLVAFAVLAANSDDEPSLVGWPLVMLIIALGLLAFALRPRPGAGVGRGPAQPTDPAPTTPMPTTEAPPP